MTHPPDYLLLGHLTHDLLPDRTTTPGGTSLYAALTAHRLGLQAAVVSAQAHLPPGWPDTIAMAWQPAPQPPTFENHYSQAGRQQRLHATAPPLALADVPTQWRNAPIVHLGPVLHETPAELAFAFPQALLGVTPQGWMRTWAAELPTTIHYLPWQPAPALLARIDALVLSVEDVHGDEALVAHYATTCPLVALTRGQQGATLWLHGQPHSIPAFPAVERDPTGAGDVFAAALLVRLHETGDPLMAAHFAACVASGSVEGPGTSSIPTRAEAEQRLEARGWRLGAGG